MADDDDSSVAPWKSDGYYTDEGLEAIAYGGLKEVRSGSAGSG